MPTIVSCKHCGVQISQLGDLWYDQGLTLREYCEEPKGVVKNLFQLHEPFVPEDYFLYEGENDMPSGSLNTKVGPEDEEDEESYKESEPEEENLSDYDDETDEDDE